MESPNCQKTIWIDIAQKKVSFARKTGKAHFQNLIKYPWNIKFSSVWIIFLETLRKVTKITYLKVVQ